jgi:hypothetical protein
MRLRNEQRPARAKHAPHFADRCRLEIVGKVVHEEAGNHHVEVFRREKCVPVLPTHHAHAAVDD